MSATKRPQTSPEKKKKKKKKKAPLGPLFAGLKCVYVVKRSKFMAGLRAKLWTDDHGGVNLHHQEHGFFFSGGQQEAGIIRSQQEELLAALTAHPEAIVMCDFEDIDAPELAALPPNTEVVRVAWQQDSIQERLQYDAKEPLDRANYRLARPTPPPPVVVEAEPVVLLSKYACCRSHTLEGDQNKEVTKYLEDLRDWWAHGVFESELKQYKFARIAQICRIISLIRCWPVRLTPENWEEEETKLKKQCFIAAESKSASGGFLAVLSQLVNGETVERADSVEKWSSDPQRRAVYEISKLKIGVGTSKATKLVQEFGVTGIDDLVKRVDEIKGGLLTVTSRTLLKTGQFPSLASKEKHAISTEEQDEILRRLREACGACREPLDCTLAGSARRGIQGSHDLDVLVRVRSESRHLARSSAYGFSEKEESLAEEICSELKKNIAAQPTVNGECFLAGGGRGFTFTSDSKMRIEHLLLRSPTNGLLRSIDVVLTPPEIFPFALLGWSGSTAFQRSLRDYVNWAHESDWANVPDKQEIVGGSGYDLNADGEPIGELIRNRKLDLTRNEHWTISQNGVGIGVGSKEVKPYLAVYKESNDNFKTEQDIFAFFHLVYRAPHERCA